MGNPMEAYSYSGGVPIIWVLASFVSAIIFLALFLGYAIPEIQTRLHHRMRVRTMRAHMSVNHERLDELILLSKIGTRTGTTPPEFRDKLRWLANERKHSEDEDLGYSIAAQEELIKEMGG